MTNVCFIADFFVNQVAGGGELNNEIVIKDLSENGYNVERMNSHSAGLQKLKAMKDVFFIVSNFINLHEDSKDYIEKNTDYVIYEHDHKYLKSRNPAMYEDYLAPEEEIINYNFYKSAKAVFCQSKFHCEIVRKNLKLDNIVNLGGNLWHESDLKKMEEITSREKNNSCSIMESIVDHKNTKGSIVYCKSKGYKYELIEPCDYHQFLDRLGKNEKLVFFPLTPETLSRVVVEARMMNMKVTTNNRVGATSEEWFKLKGLELIDFMRQKRKEIVQNVEEYING